MQDTMAPGHVYQPQLGTGIEWLPEEARLWNGGKVIATAAHQTASPWAFWHDLAFATAFPQVTHWWFRSLWTGRVQIGSAEKTPLDERTIWGWVTFDLLDQPKRIWSVTEANPVIIDTPYPPHEEQPINLPLRIILARLIQATLQDDMNPNTWIAVTSLVARDELAATFPTTHAAAAATFGGEWRLSAGDAALGLPMRAALCGAMGLRNG